MHLVRRAQWPEAAGLLELDGSDPIYGTQEQRNYCDHSEVSGAPTMNINGQSRT